jgi:hypothetical protein
MIGHSLLPIAELRECTVDEANALLVAWNHRMGPLSRPVNGDLAHALIHAGEPVAVTITSSLIRDGAGGGLRDDLTRSNTIELSRLCAARPGLCRVMLRMWREFVFPSLGFAYAISYQDADVHNGHTYRFDGWLRLRFSRAGGLDQRSGRAGRNKWIWGWPAAALRELAA